MGTNTDSPIKRKVPKVAIVTANTDIIGAHGTVMAVYSNPAVYFVLPVAVSYHFFTLRTGF